MSIYEKNLKALKEHNPRIMYKLKLADSSNVELTITKSNKVSPLVNGISLHSKYYPEKECESFFEENEHCLEKHKNILFFGIGFAYHLKDIIEKATNLNKNIILIEPNINLFNEAIKNIDLSFYIKNCIILLGERPESIIYSTWFNELRKEGVELIAHGPSSNVFKDYLINFNSLYIKKLRYKETVKELRSSASKNPELTELLNAFDEEQYLALEDIVEKMPDKLGKRDKIFLIMNELSNYKVVVK
jgi:hypothetical protein